MSNNRDAKTVAGFGDEWERFDQSEIPPDEHQRVFDMYFKIFPWHLLSDNSQGYDMGCGSGRWARLVAPRVKLLHCIDPSSAINVAKRNLSTYTNCMFHEAGVGDDVLPDCSMDFGYSLGVLHHIPDTQQGINDCVRMLKPGAPLLLYLYYALDNQSVGYRMLWLVSDLLRRLISRFPHKPRYYVCQLIAGLVYFPVARFAALLERCGLTAKKAERLPLGIYRHSSFYTMRTDALDRFGTQLEKRFSKKEIQSMMKSAGLVNINFSDESPFWCAVGFKAG